VTLEPQKSDHLDLRIVRKPTRVAKIYIPVSDDEGEMLGNTELVREVRDCIKANKKLDPEKKESLEENLHKLKTLTHRYTNLLNQTEGISIGILTKYKIWQGMLFNIIKSHLKETGRIWTYWFKQNYNPKTFRAVEDYMSIAMIPKVEAYSVYGLERLRELKRAIGDYDPEKDNDPIGTFLKANDIPLEFNNDDLFENFRVDIDRALTMEKIRKVEETQEIELKVDKEIVRKLIAKGKKIEPKTIQDMVTIKQSGGDPNKYLKDHYGNNGSKPTILTSTKTVESFPRHVAELKSSVKYLSNHRDLLTKIKTETIKDLVDLVEELKKLKKEKEKTK